MDDIERSAVAGFEIDRAWRNIEYLVGHLGGRRTGSAEELKSAEFIADQLQRIGLEPKIQAVDSWLGLPREATLTIQCPTSLELPCASDTGHGQTVSGEFLFIETAEEAWQRKDAITGKIVVVPYSYAYPITPLEVRKRGGVGMIYGNWGPSDLDVLRVTAPQTWTYWGLPDPEAFRIGEHESIPQAHIGRRTYERLRDMSKASPIFGSFKSTIESFWGKSHQVMADVEPGHAVADEDFMIMAAHHDSWNPGASDDAAGVGALIEIARNLHANRGRLRRTARFMFVSGHENGAYATTTWYLDNHWRKLREHGICFSFTDTPGFANAPEYKIEASEELQGFAVRCARDIVGNEPKINVTRGNKTADRGFYGLGVPSIYTRCAFTKAQSDEWGGAFLGYWNHSDHDTLDKVDRGNLAANARIRLLEALRLTTVELLPYDFYPVIAGMRQRLGDWQAAGRYDLTGTIEGLDRVESAVLEVQRDCAGLRHAPAKANDVLKRLSRALTWVNATYSGRYGQDIFGSNLTKPLTIMNSLDELALHGAGSPMDLMLRAKIRRDQNKVEDAFAEAIEIIGRLQ